MSLAEKLTSIKTKLANVLSDINTALVAKGASEVISLADVPTAIESVQSGGGGVVKKVAPVAVIDPDIIGIDTLDILNDLYELPKGKTAMYMIDLLLNYTDFSIYENVGNIAQDITLASFDPEGEYGLIELKGLNFTSATSLRNTFRYCDIIASLEDVNNTNPECSMGSMCEECTNLKLVTDIYFHNSATRTFRNCSNLETIIIAYLGTKISTSTFAGCTSLKNIEVKSDITDDVNLVDCPLTQETLYHLIEKLCDYSNSTAYDFVVGSENIAKIDEEHIAMLENKNWNYS